MAAAIHQQSAALLALVAHLTSQSGGILSNFSSASLQSRCAKKGKDAERLGQRLEQLFASNDATASQTATPCTSSPTRRTRSDECVSASLFGTSGRVQTQQGAGPHSMGVGACHRRLSSWGSQIDKGDLGAVACGSRAGCNRSRGLVFGVHADSDGGAAHPSFSRETSSPDTPHPAIWAACSTAVDGSVPFLLEGFGSTGNEENRNSQKGSGPKSSPDARSFSCRSGQRGFPEKEAAFPQEAQGQIGPRGLASSSDLPADVRHYKGFIGRLDLINDGLLNKTKNTFCMPELPAPSSKTAQRSHKSMAVDTLSFSKWCSFLAIAVLRTRSKFSSFLLSTMHLQRNSEVSTSPAFPLPLPFPGIFAEMPSGLSSTKRRRIQFKRALHVIVMALNFW